MIVTDVDHRGPMFDGRGERAAHRACDDIEEELTKTAARYVREGTKVFRDSTGRARSSVRVVKRARGREIRDGNLVYWPWLESGSATMRRNTSFKGYHVWAAATRRVEAESRAIAERRLPRWVREMGG